MTSRGGLFTTVTRNGCRAATPITQAITFWLSHTCVAWASAPWPPRKSERLSPPPVVAGSSRTAIMALPATAPNGVGVGEGGSVGLTDVGVDVARPRVAATVGLTAVGVAMATGHDGSRSTYWTE